jgi:hypothetical protein
MSPRAEFHESTRPDRTSKLVRPSSDCRSFALLAALCFGAVGCSGLPEAQAPTDRRVSPLPYQVRAKELGWTEPLQFPPSVCVSNQGCFDFWNELAVPRVSAASSPRPPAANATTHCSAAPIASGYLAHAAPDLLSVLQRTPVEATPPEDFSSSQGAVSWTLESHSVDSALQAWPLGSISVADATGFGDGVLVARSDGSVVQYPDAVSVPLRPIVGSLWRQPGKEPSFAVFGIGGELYRWATPRVGGLLERLPPTETPPGGYESGTLGRVWANERWVLRAFSTIAGRVWEASRRDGASARILAYGTVNACGNPLSNDVALALDGERGRFRVVALSLEDASMAWQIDQIPLDQPHCLAGNRALVAVGGRLRGQEAVAIYQHGRWSTVVLGGNDSTVEPLVTGGYVIASAPHEAVAVTANGGRRVAAAGAVYVLASNGEGWKIEQRITAAVPREMGLFGFRVLNDGHRWLINHYVGPRDPAAPSDLVDGNAVVCAAPGRSLPVE